MRVSITTIDAEPPRSQKSLDQELCVFCGSALYVVGIIRPSKEYT